MKLLTLALTGLVSMSVFARGEITCDRLNNSLAGIQNARTSDDNRADLGEKTLYIRKIANYYFEVLAKDKLGRPVGKDVYTIVTSSADGCMLLAQGNNGAGLEGKISLVITKAHSNGKKIESVRIKHNDNTATFLSER